MIKKQTSNKTEISNSTSYLIYYVYIIELLMNTIMVIRQRIYIQF